MEGVRFPLGSALGLWSSFKRPCRPPDEGPRGAGPASRPVPALSSGCRAISSRCIVNGLGKKACAPTSVSCTKHVVFQRLLLLLKVLHQGGYIFNMRQIIFDKLFPDGIARGCLPIHPPVEGIAHRFGGHVGGGGGPHQAVRLRVAVGAFRLKLARSVWVVFSWFASAAIAATASALVCLAIWRLGTLGLAGGLGVSAVVWFNVRRRADRHAKHVEDEAYERAHPEEFAPEDE